MEELQQPKIDGRVKVRCPACARVFRVKCNSVRDGMQANCMNCNKLITFSRDSEDPYIRRALRSAKDIRAAKEAAALAIYSKPMVKRETAY